MGAEAVRAGAKRRVTLAVAAGVAVLSGALLGGSALLLQRTRETARHGAERHVERTAQTLAHAINRQFLQIDAALASLPVLFSTIEGARGAISVDAAGRLLRGLNVQSFVFRDLMLVRRDGSLWASARARSAIVPLDEMMPERITGAMVLAGPAYSRRTGEWAIYLARTVTLPGEGELMAVAEVPLATLRALLAESGEQPGQRVALERRDGRLLAGLPHDELATGQPLAQPISGLRRDGAAFTLPGGPESRERIAATRPTLYGDVAVAVTLESDQALADWARDRTRIVATALLVELMLLLAGTVLIVAWRKYQDLQEARDRARTMLESAVEAMADGFVMWDRDDRLVTFNRRYRDLYAASAPALVPGTLFEDIIRYGVKHGQYPQAGTDGEAFVREVVAWHRGDHGALERLLPGGRWVLITERRTATGEIVGMRTDITALKIALEDLAAANDRAGRAMAEVQAQNAALIERDHTLRTQNLRFDAALGNMSHGLLMADAAGRLIVANRRLAEFLGVAPEALPAGAAIDLLLTDLALCSPLGDGALAQIRTRLRDLADRQRSGTFTVTGWDGRALSISQRPMADGGFVAIVEDVTEQHEAEDRIRFLAHHDPLTRLPNRVLFRSRLDDLLRGAGPAPGRAALLYLDLDAFKDVNDTLGHPVGDALLTAVGERLVACLGTQGIVARLGGDEFAVACAAESAAAEALARRIITALGAPYPLAGRTVQIGVSIGIALSGPDAPDADTLLKNADMALYEAKAGGRGVHRVFETRIAARLHERLALEADLAGALDAGQFELAYQPVFDLAAGRVCGFEALLRWNHPVRGCVSPARFIPLAEQTGQIEAIGAFVLDRACRDAAALPPGIRMAVNLSPVQLRGEDIVERIMAALDGSGLDPARLELEITESALLESNERIVAILERLRARGVRIVLDDFGTGYSSLSYLRTFPFHKIKIDQSFVREMTTRANSLAIVSAIVGLADELGMATTAEGIETADQLDFVRKVGCRQAQGYFLGRPRPILAAYETLRARPEAAALAS
ncbi:EAL domain-containing protein [Methylobacterium sp. ID0610]|uniref:EAL domain-containing protein n=1 Tax=Methylobacterium carpenticola TaxID=3344827 RepID=UPI003696B767